MRALPPLLLLSGLLLAQGARDPWERMSRFDLDGDGKVSRDEFAGPDRMFDRFDADKDGFVTKQEAQAARGRGRGTDPRRSLRRFDLDGDGRVSRGEWNGFFEKADENADGILQPEEFSAAMRGGPMRDDAPKVGAPAPRVRVKTLEGGREVDLGALRRPTVLVFGSWT